MEELYAGDQIIRAKYLMDGAGDLSEAAKRLRVYADELESLHVAGWRLRYAVHEDNGFIYLEEIEEVGNDN